MPYVVDYQIVVLADVLSYLNYAVSRTSSADSTIVSYFVAFSSNRSEVNKTLWLL